MFDIYKRLPVNQRRASTKSVGFCFKKYTKNCIEIIFNVRKSLSFNNNKTYENALIATFHICFTKFATIL